MKKRNERRLQQMSAKVWLRYGIVLLLGIGMGVIAVAWVDEQQCEIAKTALEQSLSGETDCKTVFLTAAWDHMKPMVWIWLAGFFSFFIPVSGFVIWYKSVFFGYGIGMFCRLFGMRGMWLVLATLLPQYLLFLPALVLFACCCGNMFERRTIYREGLLQYLLLLITGMVVCWFCAWVDGYVVAKLMQWVQL